MLPRRRATSLRTASVVGADAELIAELHRDGWRAATDGPPDVVLVADPAARPEDLPRTALRVGVIAEGSGSRWRSGRVLDDLDAVLVRTAVDGHKVAPATVAPPVRVGGRLGGRLTEVVDLLRARPRLHVVTGVSRLQARHRWGDHHYAVGLARAAHAAGWWPRLWCQEDRDTADHRDAALVVLLAGKLPLQAVPGVPTVAWVISHPELLDDVDPAALGELAGLHVASHDEAARLRGRGIDAHGLPQATDPTRFQPTPGGRAHELLFVANTRGQQRHVIGALTPTDRELAVYGRGWEDTDLATHHRIADHVPNADLPALYSAADVVLNDHWEQMRRRGFVANRILDAGACGALVVSDDVAGLERVVGDTVPTFRDRDQLTAVLDAVRDDPAAAAARAVRLRARVLADHTFAARIPVLTAAVSAPPSAAWPGVAAEAPAAELPEATRFATFVDAPPPPEPLDRRELIGELGRLERDVAAARDDARRARHELARTRGRRSVKLLNVVRRPSPRKLKAAVRPTPLPPSPTPVDADAVGDRARRRYARTDLARGTTPQLSAPAWRIGHLGGVRRFAGVVDHVDLAELGWERALADGLDLVLLESAPGWAPPPHLEAILARCRREGVSTVLLRAVDDRSVADDGPGWCDDLDVDHRLQEGTGPGQLPPGVAVDRWNPRGWRAAGPDPLLVAPTRLPHADRAALGRLTPLPRVLRGAVLGDPVPAGAHARDDDVPAETPVASSAALIRALRGAGVLLDDVRWHASPLAAMRLRLAAAALGVPVLAIGDDLGTPLAGQVDHLDAAGDAAHALLADADLRERVSIDVRRTALRDHGEDARFAALCDLVGLPAPRPPHVSVVVSTNRPERVGQALASVADQRYPHLEVILVLHGDGHAPDDPVPPRDDLPLTVLRAPTSWTLGDCLNAGIAASRGDLVAKMDDDDRYGPEHLTDLVLAQRHSHADVVGKRVEFVELAGAGEALRRDATTPERFRSHVSGPSLLLTAEVARQVGFRRLPRRVDTTLCERVIGLGGQVYRTHSRDLVLVRHRDGHTWQVDEDALRRGAVAQRTGDGVAWATSDPAVTGG